MPTKTETVTFPINKNPYTGDDLPTPLSGSFQFSEYENMNEIPTGERLTDEQYVKAVNARRKANARAKEMTKQLKAAGIERPDMNTVEAMTAQQIKLLIKMKAAEGVTITEEQAKLVLDAQAKLMAGILGS